jgi:hypothetical protein
VGSTVLLDLLAPDKRDRLMAGASGARRIVLNRQFFDALTLATADGLFELSKEIVDGANVPDATPLGQGLVEGGGVLAYVGRKRVGVYGTGGQTSVSKPRAAKLNPTGITVIGGFGFPARFLEEGTVHMAAQPFVTPELMARIPDAGDFIKAANIRHGITSARRAAKGDVFGASRSKP